VDIEGALHQSEIRVPDLDGQLGATHGRAVTPRQRGQHAHLLAGQLDRDTVAPHLERIEVDVEIAGSYDAADAGEKVTMAAARSVRFALIGVLPTLLSVAFAASAAYAASFTVTKTADTNDRVCDRDCSLREAISAANAAPGADHLLHGEHRPRADRRRGGDPP
jgi:CSLREA domain-containing protein